jgi:hypothetical protein
VNDWADLNEEAFIKYFKHWKLNIVQQLTLNEVCSHKSQYLAINTFQ